MSLKSHDFILIFEDKFFVYSFEIGLRDDKWRSVHIKAFLLVWFLEKYLKLLFVIVSYGIISTNITVSHFPEQKEQKSNQGLLLFLLIYWRLYRCFFKVKELKHPLNSLKNSVLKSSIASSIYKTGTKVPVGNHRLLGMVIDL